VAEPAPSRPSRTRTAPRRYDTPVFTSEALRHLAAEVGSSQLVIGTDPPIPWQDRAVDHILTAPGFTGTERRAMLGETAAKLLGITL
jgi:aminocarboxymuconate-semialdehyde decarboxylase